MGKGALRRPDGAKLNRLLAGHLFDAVGTAVRLAWQAGLLRNELSDLTWDRVSFLNREIELPDRAVPLSPELERYLLDLSVRQDWNCAAVLLSDFKRRPMRPQALSRLVRAALDDAGLPGITLTDLRDDFVIRQLEEHDWQYVSRVTGLEAITLNTRFALFLPETAPPKPTAHAAAEFDELCLRRLLQEEGGSEVGRAIRLAWQAGLRVADIAALTWRQVRFADRCIAVDGGRVPLEQELLDYLLPLKEEPDAHVVLSPRTRRPMLAERISRVVRAAMVRAGLDDLSLRDLQLEYALKTSGEARILRCVRSRGWITRAQVMEQFGMTKSAAYYRLAQLTERGCLTRVGTRYYDPAAVVPPERQFQEIQSYLEQTGVAYRQDLARLLHIEARQCTVVLNHLIEDGKLTREGQKYSLKNV